MEFFSTQHSHSLPWGIANHLPNLPASCIQCFLIWWVSLQHTWRWIFDTSRRKATHIIKLIFFCSQMGKDEDGLPIGFQVSWLFYDWCVHSVHKIFKGAVDKVRKKSKKNWITKWVWNYFFCLRWIYHFVYLSECKVQLLFFTRLLSGHCRTISGSKLLCNRSRTGSLFRWMAAVKLFEISFCYLICSFTLWWKIKMNRKKLKWFNVSF